MCRRNVLPPCLILLDDIQLRLHREFNHVAENAKCLRFDLFRAHDLDTKTTRFNDPLFSKGEFPCVYRNINRRFERMVKSLGIAGMLNVRGLSGKYPAILNISRTWSCGLDVIWQPAREDPTVHPLTVTLP